MNDVTSIGSLFFGRRPTTISWRIMAIGVNAVDGTAWRRLAHVGKKVLKREPSLTNRNTPTTPILELLVSWIKTAVFHASPAAISAGYAVTYRMAMPAVLFVFQFAATATNRMSVSKISTSDNGLFPAITKTHPMNFSSWFAVNMKGEKPAEFLSRYIENVHA